MCRGDYLVLLTQTRNQVDKRPLPERMLVQLQLVDEYHRLMHALGDKADQQKQDVFFATAQTFVGVIVLPIGKVNVKLAQPISDGSDNAARSADLGIFLL